MNASTSEGIVIIYYVLWCDCTPTQDCLGIQNLSGQKSAACTGVNFLLHHRVLYEIITFGLQDSAEKVPPCSFLFFLWYLTKLICSLCILLIPQAHVWSIGEHSCQGRSAIPAQGTIDNDAINLGQIQWGALPGHTHFTGGLFMVVLQQRHVWNISLCLWIIKCVIFTLGHKEWTLRCKRERISLVYIICVLLFPVWAGTKEKAIFQPTSFNCSVRDNGKPRKSSWICMRFWQGCQVWFNSRRPFRDGPSCQQGKMKPPLIKAVQILFTVALRSWNSLLLAALSSKSDSLTCVCDRAMPALKSHLESASCWLAT